MNEQSTDVYIDKLEAFVRTINGRVNRITGLAPKNVKKDPTSFLVSLAQTNKSRTPKFDVGEKVRICRRVCVFHKGYKIQFTHEVFEVVKTLTPNPSIYHERNRRHHCGKILWSSAGEILCNLTLWRNVWRRNESFIYSFIHSLYEARGSSLTEKLLTSLFILFILIHINSTSILIGSHIDIVFTIDLVSDASMGPFSENTMAKSTTLLPVTILLYAEGGNKQWQVG